MIQKFLNWWKYGDGDIPGSLAVILYVLFGLGFGVLIMLVLWSLYHVRII